MDHESFTMGNDMSYTGDVVRLLPQYNTEAPTVPTKEQQQTQKVVEATI